MPVGQEKSVDDAISGLNQQRSKGLPVKSKSNLQVTDMKTSGNRHLLCIWIDVVHES